MSEFLHRASLKGYCVDIRYVIRYRNAPTLHPELIDFMSDITSFCNGWIQKVEAGSFPDPIARHPTAARDAIFNIIRKELQELSQRTSKALPVSQETTCTTTYVGPSVGLLAAINREYDGPGELSPDGPRHSNGEHHFTRSQRLTSDHVHIRDIAIPPASDEMASVRPAYIPINMPGAKHHLPDDSMAKMWVGNCAIPVGLTGSIDIQFRLLRADSIAGLQQGLHAVQDDVQADDFKKTERTFPHMTRTVADNSLPPPARRRWLVHLPLCGPRLSVCAFTAPKTLH